jgi:hypothetical protein
MSELAEKAQVYQRVEENAVHLVLRAYFLGVATGEFASAAPSSIPNVQCASTLFPSDFALIITLHIFSWSFCVT